MGGWGVGFPTPLQIFHGYALKNVFLISRLLEFQYYTVLNIFSKNHENPSRTFLFMDDFSRVGVIVSSIPLIYYLHFVEKLLYLHYYYEIALGA